MTTATASGAPPMNPPEEAMPPICARVSRFWMTTKFHGWRLRALGAQRAACNIRRITLSGTGSGLNSRTVSLDLMHW